MKISDSREHILFEIESIALKLMNFPDKVDSSPSGEGEEQKVWIEGIPCIKEHFLDKVASGGGLARPGSSEQAYYLRSTWGGVNVDDFALTVPNHSIG